MGNIFTLNLLGRFESRILKSACLFEAYLTSNKKLPGLVAWSCWYSRSTATRLVVTATCSGTWGGGYHSGSEWVTLPFPQNFTSYLKVVGSNPVTGVLLPLLLIWSCNFLAILCSVSVSSPSALHKLVIIWNVTWDQQIQDIVSTVFGIDGILGWRSQAVVHAYQGLPLAVRREEPEKNLGATSWWSESR